jgi:hypothetical protein
VTETRPTLRQKKVLFLLILKVGMSQSDTEEGSLHPHGSEQLAVGSSHAKGIPNNTHAKRGLKHVR